MAAQEPVDVWIADLDAPVPARCAGLLSDAERARAAAFANEPARARWTASRAVLRALVGDFASLDPQALRFALGPHGKPRLAASSLLGGERRAGGEQRAGGEVCFNLSHSGPIAVYALAWDREVGIDVELVDRGRSASRDELAIARRLLGEEAQRRLASLPPSQRADAFLREWTAYEARVKCLGLGIGAARGDSATAERLSELTITEVDVGEGAFAVLASEGGPPGARTHAWR